MNHYKQLESMYLHAPINSIYQPEISISEGEAKIDIEVKSDYFHSAGAMHGSVYFKSLDDSAFFAANSYEEEVFVLTTSFTTYITRPVSEGKLETIGKVVNKNRSQWVCESIAYNNGKEVARGSGIFVRSKVKLVDALGYKI